MTATQPTKAEAAAKAKEREKTMSAEIKTVERETGCRLVTGPDGFEVYRLEGTPPALVFKGSARTRPQAVSFMEGVLSMIPKEDEKGQPTE